MRRLGQVNAAGRLYAAPGEYRYADYGTYKPSFFVGSGDVEVFANVKVKSQILTAGLAYMFPIAR